MPPEVLQILREYGFATTVALMMFYGGWRFLAAVWKELVIPIRDDVREFIRTTIRNQESNVEARIETVGVLRTLSETMHAVNRNIEAIGERQHKHMDVCKGETRTGQ